MRPVLFVVRPPDIGTALLIDLALFLLLLGWRRVARALGENVPPLTVSGVLLTWLGATVATAILYWLLHRFGPLPIKSYGTMLVIGFIVATAWCMKDGRRLGYQPVIFLDLAVYLLVGSLIGARILYVLLDWSSYASSPRAILAVWEGGLSFHGGVLGALAAGWLFTRRRGLKFLELADVVAPAIALGYAFGRIGCFLNGCCYGRPTSLPWGVRFPCATWLDGRPITVPVHPAQLYASVASLLIFVLLLWLRRFARRDGHIFLFFIILYSVYRFAIEFIRRGVTGRPWSILPALTEAQAASIVLLVVAAAVVAATWKAPGKSRGRPRRGSRRK